MKLKASHREIAWKHFGIFLRRCCHFCSTRMRNFPVPGACKTCGSHTVLLSFCAGLMFHRQGNPALHSSECSGLQILPVKDEFSPWESGIALISTTPCDILSPPGILLQKIHCSSTFYFFFRHWWKTGGKGGKGFRFWKRQRECPSQPKCSWVGHGFLCSTYNGR